MSVKDGVYGPPDQPNKPGTWRYFAQRFDGTGNLGEFLDHNLPLEGVQIDEVLSGHNAMSASVSPELARLKGPDGRPIFDEYGVCIWAESPDGQVYGGILERSGLDGPTWSLDVVDLSSAMIGMPFDDATFFINVDPLDVFRYLWTWYQARPGCNLGIDADSTHSPVTLGGDLTQIVEFDEEADDPVLTPESLAPSAYPDNATWVAKAKKKFSKKPYNWKGTKIEALLNLWLSGSTRAFEGFWDERDQKMVTTVINVLGLPPFPPGDPISAAPTAVNPVTYEYDAYKLNWYTNHDLSADIDDLASNTPFDWHLVHNWGDDADDADLFHHFRLGYPKLGRTISELRFVVGENIHQVPGIERDGEEYANEVIVLGNGEGVATIRGRAFREHPGRMRKTVVIVDQTLTSVVACNNRASQELAARATLDEITEVVMINHLNAPVGSVQLGDEFLLEGDIGWASLSVWVRCIGRSFTPDDGDQMRLSVIRTDRVG